MTKAALREVPGTGTLAFQTLLSFTNAPNCAYVFREDVVLPSRKAHFINGAQDLGDDYNNGCYCRTLIGNINAGTLVIRPSAEEDAASSSPTWKYRSRGKHKYRGQGGTFFSPQELRRGH